jgi:hypothetical protein
MRRTFIYERAVVAPTPTPSAPAPFSPPPAPAFPFDQNDSNTDQYYVVPLTSGKTVVVCLNDLNHIENKTGPFATYEDALKFISTKQ